MNLLIILLLVASASAITINLDPTYPDGRPMNSADRIENLAKQIQDLQTIYGGTDGPLPKILNYVKGILSQAKDEHSMFVASDDGQIHHAGIIGDLVGAVLGVVSLALGGNPGMCGSADGLFMKQHQGLLGETMDLLTPLLGPLVSDVKGTGILHSILKDAGLDRITN